MAISQHGRFTFCLVFFSHVHDHIRAGYPVFFDRTQEKKSETPKYVFGWDTILLRVAAAGIFAKPSHEGTVLDHTLQTCLLDFLKYGQIYASGSL